MGRGRLCKEDKGIRGGGRREDGEWENGEDDKRCGG